MKKNHSKSRRNFLKGVAGTSALGMLGQLSMIKSSVAAPVFNDYKAMVCIFLHGGNDSFNMLIPTDSSSDRGYADYEAVRGDLAVDNFDLGLANVSNSASDLNKGTLGGGIANPYNVDNTQRSAYTKGLYNLSGSNGINVGVNGVMPELAQLITDNKVSIIANSGSLVTPVTRDEIIAGTDKLPLFLFAHNHQQRALKTAYAHKLKSIGWAGRIADNWIGINNGSLLGLNVSLSGNDVFLNGNISKPLVLKSGIPPKYFGMVKGSGNAADERRAIFRALAGRTANPISGNLHYDESNTFNSIDPFKRIYGSKLNTSLSTFDTLNQAWGEGQLSYASTGSYGESLFSVPDSATLGLISNIDGSLIQQLESVTKMIDQGAKDAFLSGSYNRQIFYVELSGFDTHADQASRHPLKLRELSLALWKFQKALEELGHANKVVSFTMSDFGRKLQTNVNGGTDHAWGGHQLVMGGDGLNNAGNLKGGQLFGEMPDLRPGGEDDYKFNGGHIIPKISQDQVSASISNWFGVDAALIPEIFPNLSNFESEPGVIDSAFLNLFS